MTEILPFLGRALRYGLAGVLNGIVSLSLIALLDLGLHVRPELANAAGYAAGVTLGFILARGFVFQNGERVATTGPRYVLIIAVAFLLNQLVLRAALYLLGHGTLQHAAAQLSGITTYTVLTFLGCHVWVFRSQKGRPDLPLPLAIGDRGARH